VNVLSRYSRSDEYVSDSYWRYNNYRKGGQTLKQYYPGWGKNTYILVSLFNSFLAELYPLLILKHIVLL